MKVKELISLLNGVSNKELEVLVLHADFGFGNNIPTNITGVTNLAPSGEQQRYGHQYDDEIPMVCIAIEVKAMC